MVALQFDGTVAHGAAAAAGALQLGAQILEERLVLRQAVHHCHGLAAASGPLRVGAAAAEKRESESAKCVFSDGKIPPKEEVVKTITTVLAKRGYLPADPKHPPSILLMWTWGTMNTDRIYSGNPDDIEGRQVNQRQLMRFMGAYKLGLISKEPSAFQDMTPGVLFRDADQELITQLATEDLYVAAISAYDFNAAAKKEIGRAHV